MNMTYANMKKLRLSSMSQALEQQLRQPGVFDDLSFVERLDFLLEHELQSRRTRRHKRLIKEADFRLSAGLHQLHYSTERNLNRRQIAELGLCHWVERCQNLLIVGACGTGKTFVSNALGHAACLLDYKVRYARIQTLLMWFQQAKAVGNYPKLIAQLSAVSMLIVDDFGVQPLNDMERYDLLELMDRRYQRSSTVFVSQLPVDNWHACIGDATLADAILDRIIHNAHRIELKGESMRKRQATVDSENDSEDQAGPLPSPQESSLASKTPQ